MIVYSSANTTNTNNTVNQQNNHGVTFTDQPVASASPASATSVSSQATVVSQPESQTSVAVASQAPASASVVRQSVAPVSSSASVVSHVTSQVTASAAKQTVSQPAVRAQANNFATQPTSAAAPASQSKDNNDNYPGNVEHYVSVPFKVSTNKGCSSYKQVVENYEKLPEQTFTQDMTYVDQVTGKSITGTTSYTEKKGDGRVVCDPVLPDGWCVPENISTKIPRIIYQPVTKITLPVVNPYNVAQSSLEKLAQEKTFEFMSMDAGNSIWNPASANVAPGCCIPCQIKINFVTPDGKTVSTATIKNDNLDLGSWAAPVKAPQGYKFVDPRENWASLKLEYGELSKTFNYPVELLATNNTTSAASPSGTQSKPAIGNFQSQSKKPTSSNGDPNTIYNVGNGHYFGDGTQAVSQSASKSPAAQNPTSVGASPSGTQSKPAIGNFQSQSKKPTSSNGDPNTIYNVGNGHYFGDGTQAVSQSASKSPVAQNPTSVSKGSQTAGSNNNNVNGSGHVVGNGSQSATKPSNGSNINIPDTSAVARPIVKPVNGKTSTQVSKPNGSQSAAKPNSVSNNNHSTTSTNQPNNTQNGGHLANGNQASTSATKGSVNASQAGKTSVVPVQHGSQSQGTAQKSAIGGFQSQSKPSRSLSQAGNHTNGNSASASVNINSSSKNNSGTSASSPLGSVATGNQSQGKENNKPISSASNLNDAHLNNNGSSSATVNGSQPGSVASSNANKPSLSQSLQINRGSANINQVNAGKGSVTSVSGKDSVVTGNKASQASSVAKGNQSSATNGAKTQSQGQHANGSVATSTAKDSVAKGSAKRSEAVSQSSAAVQSGKGNQWQSQGQHVNVKKSPAKVIKASTPVAQLAIKRAKCACGHASSCATPCAKTCGQSVVSAPVAQQASTPVTTSIAQTSAPAAAPVAQQASAPAQTNANVMSRSTGSVASHNTTSSKPASSSSSNSMPNTGMNDDSAATLGLVGMGLALGIVAKQFKKSKK